MQRARILFHACVAVDVDLHGIFIGALNGEEGCAGGDGDNRHSIIRDLEPFVVDGVEMIGAHDEVEGYDGPAGFTVEQEDGDGLVGLRMKGQGDCG